MASLMIHMAVAVEINKVIKKDYEKLLFGAVAPDISKIIKEGRNRAHFIDKENSNIPNLNNFLNKYKNNLEDDFVLGYYIHLYTDYLWYKHFYPRFYDLNKQIIKLHNGDNIPYNYDEFLKYAYIDFTSLDSSLKEYYDVDVNAIYNTSYKSNIIEEVNFKKIDEFKNWLKKLYDNSTKKECILFDFNDVKDFISSSVNIILDDLRKN